MPQFLGSFFKKRSGSDPDASQEISPIKELLTLFGVFILLVFCFSMANLPGGDDWATFYGATQRVLHNQQLYGTKINSFYLMYMPWDVLVVLPLGLLPFRVGWGVLSALSMVIIFLVMRRWKTSPFKLLLVLLSPPTFYILLHGTIDAFVLSFMFLPYEFWLLGALSKPQNTIALGLNVLRSNLVKTAIVTGGVILLTFIILGNWVPAYLSQHTDFWSNENNVMHLFFPYSIIVGLVMIYYGWKKNDVSFLVGASPMLSPYGATSSMLGPFMFLAVKLNDWQLLLVFLAYWGWALFKL